MGFEPRLEAVVGSTLLCVFVFVFVFVYVFVFVFVFVFVCMCACVCVRVLSMFTDSHPTNANGSTTTHASPAFAEEPGAGGR